MPQLAQNCFLHQTMVDVHHRHGGHGGRPPSVMVDMVDVHHDDGGRPPYFQIWWTQWPRSSPPVILHLFSRFFSTEDAFTFRAG